MRDDEREDNTIYKVVVNHEEQYSIWPADRENALGWNDAGKTGTKEECLAYIKEVWTDMRPLSLRKKMEDEFREGNKQGSHKVVRNTAGQYSIWPADDITWPGFHELHNSTDWHDTGQVGTEWDCLNYLSELRDTARELPPDEPRESSGNFEASGFTG